jgi:hypothetical protein
VIRDTIRDVAELRNARVELMVALAQPGLTWIERRELEAALYALSWVVGAFTVSPMAHHVPSSGFADMVRDRAAELVADQLAQRDQRRRTTCGIAECEDPAHAAVAFIERSQPREAIEG